jgi:GxxExxY protein
MHELDASVNALSANIVDAALAVHRALGPGYLEAFYEEALCIELEARAVPFERQWPLQVRYRDRLVGTHRVDLVVAGVVIVELKAVEQMTQVHRAQVLSYLHASRLELGLLINFNVPLLKSGIRRVIATT